MSDYTKQDYKDFFGEFKTSAVKVKKSPKKEVSDMIVDLFLEGDCPDSISQKLDISYDKVVNELVGSGLM